MSTPTPIHPLADILATLDEYQRTYTIVGRAHYISADRFGLRHRWLGVPVVVISTVVGTTIFGTLNKDPEIGWRIAAGLFSMLGAVLAALQTFFGYGQIAERHKSAATRYRAVRRRLKNFSLKYAQADGSQRSQAISELEALNKDLESMAAESPTVPDACYSRAEAEYKAEHP
jgi:SMODS and SLOG-associating 2TM effector domain family 4